MAQDGFPLSITLKAGTGYDAPWVVVYGHTPDEVDQKLQSIIEGSLLQSTIEAANALKAANAASRLLKGGEAAEAPAQAAPWGKPKNSAPANSGATLHPEGKECTGCGSVLEYKVINRKSDGKQFKMWSCPNGRSKNDGHDSEFVN